MPVPENLYLPNGAANLGPAVYVDSRADGVVTFFPAGGGGRRPLRAVEFETGFHQVSQEEFDQLHDVYERVAVTADWFEDLPSMRGYSNGQLWNGFLTPVFEKDEILAAIADARLGSNPGSIVSFDERHNAFVSIMTPGGEALPEFDHLGAVDAAIADNCSIELSVNEEEVWVTVFPSLQITVDGNDVEVFAIGDGWVWQRAPEEEIEPQVPRP